MADDEPPEWQPDDWWDPIYLAYRTLRDEPWKPLDFTGFWERDGELPELW